MSIVQRLFNRPPCKHPWAWAAALLVSATLLFVMPDLLRASSGTHAAPGSPEAGEHITPNFREIPDLTAKVLMFVLQLAVTLSAAKLMGWVSEMVKVPGVLGELAAGMIIGPYLLGNMIVLPLSHGGQSHHIPLFPSPDSRYQVLAGSAEFEARTAALGLDSQTVQQLRKRFRATRSDQRAVQVVSELLLPKAAETAQHLANQPDLESLLTDQFGLPAEQVARLKSIAEGRDRQALVAGLTETFTGNAERLSRSLAAGVSPQWPVSTAIWEVAVLASIVLLFMAGLHTDLKQFLANLGPATICAIGGVITPFFLGAWTTTLFKGGGMWDSDALFMGAIMVATSVGITARVLSDIRKLDTPEGVTILGGAVVDDVLGILVLAIVVGISDAAATGKAIATSDILFTIGKAVGVWVGLTGVSLVLAPVIERALNGVKYAGARVALGLALALLGAGIAEFFGLAFIIGAYSVGLGLSRVKIAHRLMDEMEGVYHFTVPIFFACMGMLVDYNAMSTALAFGALISVWGILSKIFGCGLPALAWFNIRGAARIGMGMLPRGEVALIIAGVGLAKGVITGDIFGVSIMMTLVTTVIAPLGLVPLFRGGPGRRGQEGAEAEEQETELIAIDVPAGLVHSYVALIGRAAAQKGYKTTYEGDGIYMLRGRDDRLATVTQRDSRVDLDAPARLVPEMREILDTVENMMISAVRQIHDIEPPPEA